MRRSLTLFLLVPVVLLAAGCASGTTAPRVVWLGDGVFKSPSPQDAEAYCRNFGAPLRYLDPKGPRAPVVGEVTYRCD
ncbi:hypothetical protein ABIC94_002786 [Variovorax paradoxus]|uniref:hypothetical protein n=1 Tax=Variovorax paradoxus TaxID=34073 RepID=UPI003395892E